MSQKFCTVFVVHEAQFNSFCWGCEGGELHWTERCQGHLILSKCYSLDSLEIYSFRSTWPCLVFKVLATWVKFLELFSYCSLINFCATQMFLIASTVLLLSSKTLSIGSWIRLCCPFLCVVFKWHMKLINV